MNRPAPIGLGVFLLVSIAVLATDGISTPAFNPDPSTGSQKKVPSRSQTGASRDKSRHLQHKGTEQPQPVVDSLDGGPQSHAVIIGISAYKNLPLKSQLQFADQDADRYSRFSYAGAERRLQT